MPRIAGVDIPENKKIGYSLRYIYGIGPSTGQSILRQTRIDPDRRIRDLTEDEVRRLRTLIDQDFKVEGDLRREIQQPGPEDVGATQFGQSE